MTESASPPQFEIQVRVRYDEADPMGFVHHANYLRYFELCRVEMLRAAGGSYRQVEEEGEFVVVVRADVKYRSSARYDDVLNVRMEVTKIGRAKVEHHYQIDRAGQLITEATLTLAVIDRDGNVLPIPDWMRLRVDDE